MNAIGGYFELEIGCANNGIHENAALALKSGRACLRVLCQQFSPSRVWIPYYCCDAVLEPLKQQNVEFCFYSIDDSFEIANNDQTVTQNECILYVNYFGLKGDYAQELQEKYGSRLWVDNTHAFFNNEPSAISCRFNSARKFFGVPDGAYLYFPIDVSAPAANSWPRHRDYRFEHLILRHQGKIDEGYAVFQHNEQQLGGKVERISAISEKILRRVNYDDVAAKRRENFTFLHTALSQSNKLSDHISRIEDKVPLCYPYLPDRPMERTYFWKHKVFVPTFWRECLSRVDDGFQWEKQLSSDLLPLPIDQRYGTAEMERIVEVINSYE